jgi:hypothetical protein
VRFDPVRSLVPPIAYSIWTPDGGYSFSEPCLTWVEENIPSWRYRVYRCHKSYDGYLGYTVRIVFQRVADAVAFKLRWHDNDE